MTSSDGKHLVSYLCLAAIANLALAGCPQSHGVSTDGDGDVDADGDSDASDVLAPSCSSMCSAIVAAACESDTDLDDCVADCEVVRESDCRGQIGAVMTCAASSPAYECAADGTGRFEGCDTEHDALDVCLEMFHDFNCDGVCPGVVAASCEGGPPTLADCLSGCAATPPACRVQLAAVVACGGESLTFICSSEGLVYVEGCEAEHDRLYDCLGM